MQTQYSSNAFRDWIIILFEYLWNSCTWMLKMYANGSWDYVLWLWLWLEWCLKNPWLLCLCVLCRNRKIGGLLAKPQLGIQILEDWSVKFPGSLHEELFTLNRVFLFLFWVFYSLLNLCRLSSNNCQNGKLMNGIMKNYCFLKCCRKFNLIKGRENLNLVF